MPKQRRDRSVSLDRSRAYPFPCSSTSSSRQPLAKNSNESQEKVKEWEEARCPVCMEHPHNAILLICSSHEIGCRPYMCDTSYRHSNCFDQFRKSFAETSTAVPPREGTPPSTTHSAHAMNPEAIEVDLEGERNEEGSTSTRAVPCQNQVKSNLVCPLCRGQINGWIAVESARRFMNAKSRSCACETCDYSGTYADLRKHARLVHPQVRPSEADPERQQDWMRMEQERNLGDLISTLQFPVGDETSGDRILSINEGRGLTVFFVVRVSRPGSSLRSSGWSGTSRARAQVTSRRRRSTRHWGVSYDGDTAPAPTEDNNEPADGPSSP